MKVTEETTKIQNRRVSFHNTKKIKYVLEKII